MPGKWCFVLTVVQYTERGVRSDRGGVRVCRWSGWSKEEEASLLHTI